MRKFFCGGLLAGVIAVLTVATQLPEFWAGMVLGASIVWVFRLMDFLFPAGVTLCDQTTGELYTVPWH